MWFWIEEFVNWNHEWLHPAIPSIHPIQSITIKQQGEGDARWGGVWEIDAMEVWHIMLGFWEHSPNFTGFTSNQIISSICMLRSFSSTHPPLLSLSHFHHWPISTLPNFPMLQPTLLNIFLTIIKNYKTSSKMKKPPSLLFF